MGLERAEVDREDSWKPSWKKPAQWYEPERVKGRGGSLTKKMQPCIYAADIHEI